MDICVARGDLRAGDVAWRVAAQTWPLQALTALMLVAAALTSLSTQEWVWLRVAAQLELFAAVGLAGAFALHETAHALALRRCSGVSHVVVGATAWRFSLEPRGTITARQVVGVALAGPLAAGAAGLLWWVIAPQARLHWWFLVHLAFLLPVFGDGRSLISALLMTRTRQGGCRWKMLDSHHE